MKLIKLLTDLREVYRSLRRLEGKTSALASSIHAARIDTLLLAGQTAALALRKDIASIQEAQFRVFSQYEEDGIIQFLIQRLGSRLHRSFVEFGVQDYMESNTLFLLMHNGWRGLVIDGEPTYINSIRRLGFDWKYGLAARCDFVTRENINAILLEEGFAPELGLLSIDVDSVDWHLWDALTVVKPGIVIVEYNPLFAIDRPLTIPYELPFDRAEKHKSLWYYGTSLAALAVLAKEKGYTFVGVESHRQNAFFVRDDLAPHVPAEVLGKDHVDKDTAKVTETLRGLPVFNAATRAIEEI